MTDSGVATNKKYNIIDSIEDDAPFGEVNYYTISFLTPQKIEKIGYFKIRGLKIHNAYTSPKAAYDDAKKIKKNNNKHDVYVAEVGKLYGWDDATKVDEIEYDDQKLNDLEKTRRENMDKIKLMSEQFNNEYKTLHANDADTRKNAQVKRMQQKLYEKGLITKKEFEMLQEVNKPLNEIKDEAAKREKIDEEIEEAYKTDYLDENPPTGLKFACISIYSPKKIGNLKTLCFKVRGVFQTVKDLDKRIKKLESLYPRDQIRKQEIGKWCGFSETDDVSDNAILRQLNYSMKCHIEHLDVEKEEFEKRKEKMTKQNVDEQKLKQLDNRKARRKETRKNKRKQSEGPITSETSPTNILNAEPVSTSTENDSTPSPITYINNPDDAEKITDIFNFLNDPELRDKFPSDKNKSERVNVLDSTSTPSQQDSNATIEI